MTAMVPILVLRTLVLVGDAAKSARWAIWDAYGLLRARTRIVRTTYYDRETGQGGAQRASITRDRAAVIVFRPGQSAVYPSRIPDLVAWRVGRDLRRQGYAPVRGMR